MFCEAQTEFLSLARMGVLLNKIKIRCLKCRDSAVLNEI